ncbi:MAG: ArsR/SmtB family transcription factor [Pseudobdellovibrionaceae bacterium]
MFHALSDSTRRDILSRLSKSDLSIKALSEDYEMTLAAVSKHIRVLVEAKLVKTTKEGRVHRCQMTPEPLKNITEVVAEYQKFWSHQLDALDLFLNENK